MTKRGKALLLVGLLLAVLIACAIYFASARAKAAPSGNARFVWAAGAHMQERTHVQMPLGSVNGNGGTHRPELEIRYKAGRAHTTRGRA